MSSITTDQGILHYEVLGRGKPIILLHGWLGSWGLWRETMAYLSQYYRTYALDFWGFGESGKKRSTYVRTQVHAIHEAKAVVLAARAYAELEPGEELPERRLPGVSD